MDEALEQQQHLEEFMAEPDHIHPDEEEDDTGLSLWAARALLLLVAAIWGTNFAVRDSENESVSLIQEPSSH